MRTSSSRRATSVVGAAALVIVGLGVAPASAVNADHGARLVADVPSDITPHAMDGSVDAITQIGNTVYAAGSFTKVSPADSYGDTSDDLVRNRIFAFDATTGAIDRSFAPNLSGDVNSLDTDGTSLYVAGSFGSVNGDTSIKRLVKLSASGAVVGGFEARPNGFVNEVVVRGQRVYIGGGFTTVLHGGTWTPRGALAALNPSNGALLSSVDLPFTGVYDPNNNLNGKAGGNTSIKRFDVSPDGSRLVAVGNFSEVGGATHSQLAVVDTSGANATVASWSTNRFDRAHNSCAKVFDSFIRDVTSPRTAPTSWSTTTGAYDGGAVRPATPRRASRSTRPRNERATVLGRLHRGRHDLRVEVTQSAVFVGGHMRWENNPFAGDNAGAGAVSREGIAALDPVNGLPLCWNPGRTKGVGASGAFSTDARPVGRLRHRPARALRLPRPDRLLPPTGYTVPGVATAGAAQRRALAPAEQPARR